MATASQESDKIRLRREAKKAKGFYVEDEPKVVFAIRIRGINDMHPKARLSRNCRLGPLWWQSWRAPLGPMEAHG